MIISPLQDTAMFDIKWIRVPVHVTQGFGKKNTASYLLKAYQAMGLDGHPGHDLRAKVGTPIFASFDGKVKVKNSGKSGYGLHVKIRKEDRECVVGHMSQVKVLSGTTVRTGQLLGYSGNTGFSTSPHVHFAFRNIIPDYKEKDIFKWKVKNYNNGYKGYWDVAAYVITFKGSLTEHTIS